MRTKHLQKIAMLISFFFIFITNNLLLSEATVCEFCCNINITNSYTCVTGGYSYCYAKILNYHSACCSNNGDPNVPCQVEVTGAWTYYRDVDSGSQRECTYLCSGSTSSSCYVSDPPISSSECAPLGEIIYYFDVPASTCLYTNNICPMPY